MFLRYFILIFFTLTPVLNFVQEIMAQEKPQEEKITISPETKISLLPKELQARYREIYEILPEDKRNILVSVIQYLSTSTLEKFIGFISKMPIVEIIKILDELYLIRDPIDREMYIIKKIQEKEKEVSVVEKFYSAGPDIGIAPSLLKQVGYDIVSAQPLKEISPQFISQGYTLGPGDSLFVYVWGKVRLPETVSFPMVVTVLSDGKIFIPLVGPVLVGGTTIENASEIIKAAVRKVLGEVEVAVSLSSLKSIPVVVMGEVRNPGVVVLSGTLSPFEAIQKAGGIRRSGSLRNIEIRREGKTVAKIDMYDLIFRGISEGIMGGITLRAWDIVFVPRIGKTFAIVGAVKQQGIYEMRGDREALEEAIELAGGTIPEQGTFRIRIKRFVGDSRQTVLDIFWKGGEKINYYILDGDIVEIYPAFFEKEDRYILVSGYVKKAQKIPYFENMTLKDSVMLSGGFLLSEPPWAYEIIRRIDGEEKKFYKEIPQEERRKGIDNVLNILEKEKILPYDRITIFPPPESELPEYIEVRISGEVKFPGRYLMQKGDRLYDLLKKAGGFTEEAYPEGIVFIRQQLKEEQARKTELVVQLLIKEILSEYSQYVQIGGVPIRQATGGLTDRIRTMRQIMELGGITGRIVIKVPRNIEELKKSPYNIELQPDDEIYVPRPPNYVIVAGEVKSPATFSYVKGEDAKFYIELAGGYTKFANKSEVFIIRADGSSDTDLSRVFGGDTIVVPPKLRIPYETWYVVRDVLSVSFQGLTAGALILNAVNR